MRLPPDHAPRSTTRNRQALIFRILFLGTLVFFASLGTGCARLGLRILLGQSTQGNPHAVLHPDPSYEIVELHTKNGTRIVGQFGKALDRSGGSSNDPTQTPTVLFFYGSHQTLSAPRDQIIFNGLRAMGVNVFIPEFPGIGMSEGSFSEANCYATADAALDYLLSRTDIDHRRIITAGSSLGTGTAVDLASRRPLAGLIVVGAFTSTTDGAAAAKTWIPHWLASSLTADCRFDNLAKIKSVPCPILLVYGLSDTTTPPWMSDSLAKAATAPVTRIPLPGVHHNDLWKSKYFGLNKEVRDWLHAQGMK